MILVVIADEEPLTRREIRQYLDRAHGVEVVGECTSGQEAVHTIRELGPDLVFMDVQMPGLDGFRVIEALGLDRMPSVIFITASERHALRAFRAGALDFLLKPINEERLKRALDRAKRSIAERRALTLSQRLTATMSKMGVAEASPHTPRGGARLERFLVKQVGRVVVISVDEIDWIEAVGDQVRLHVGRETHLLSETMARIEEQLDPRRFQRIHGRTIVNMERVQELHLHSNRDHTIVLQDGTELELRRSYANVLEALLSGRP